MPITIFLRFLYTVAKNEREADGKQRHNVDTIDGRRST